MRDSSLHAIHAVGPAIASVWVGQKLPPAAQIVNAVAPGSRPGPPAPAAEAPSAATARSAARVRTPANDASGDRAPWDDYR